MLHTCAARFDVTGNLEKMLETKPSLRMEGRERGSCAGSLVPCTVNQPACVSPPGACTWLMSLPACLPACLIPSIPRGWKTWTRRSDCYSDWSKISLVRQWAKRSEAWRASSSTCDRDITPDIAGRNLLHWALVVALTSPALLSLLRSCCILLNSTSSSVEFGPRPNAATRAARVPGLCAYHAYAWIDDGWTPNLNAAAASSSSGFFCSHMRNNRRPMHVTAPYCLLLWIHMCTAQHCAHPAWVSYKIAKALFRHCLVPKWKNFEIL